MKYKLAIFDLDGTILDTLQDLADATNYVLKKNGYPLRSLEEVRQFVGNGIYMLVRRAVPKELSDQKVQDLTEQFKLYYKDHCKDKTEAYPGIISLLKKLKEKGIKTAVVSNKADYAVQILVQDFFPDLFDKAVGEKENVRKKPCPDAVNEVLRELKVVKEEAVYIGDSEVDIQTAQNAQLNCISVCYGFRSKQFLRANKAKILVDNVNELYKEITGEENGNMA
ncbi:MAG: HAD-IA family hydrolase [Erysipelotrichia bacterium]|nr:HAD-IA family hydrolase [Erysipelotrichia bacterium]